jgi:hypothetical protein
MKTTKRVHAPKQAKAAKAVKATLPPVSEQSQLDAFLWEDIKRDLFMFIGKLPEISWKRTACGWFAALATTLGVSYVGCWLAEVLAIAALTLTGSGFLGLLILFTGLIFTVLVAGKVGAFTHIAVITGAAERLVQRAWNALPFTTKEQLA